MTKNQIDYASYLENRRHNLETEGLQKDSNRISEEHYQRADTASFMQAQASGIQAQAAATQAAAAMQNASTNRISAVTNLMGTLSDIAVNTSKIKVNEADVEVKGSQRELNESSTEKNRVGVVLDTRKQDLSEKYYELDRYKANLSGMQFKESVRQYNKTYELQERDTTRKEKDSRVDRFSKTVTTLVGKGGYIPTLLKFIGK